MCLEEVACLDLYDGNELSQVVRAFSGATVAQEQEKEPHPHYN